MKLFEECDLLTERNYDDCSECYRLDICLTALHNEYCKTEQQWIPCSERLPENTDPVNITWTNRDPGTYYAHIKNVPFVATGHYHNGKWWWYSATCQDYLDEYGESGADRVADGIEIIAWMPLPESYKGE